MAQLRLHDDGVHVGMPPQYRGRCVGRFCIPCLPDLPEVPAFADALIENLSPTIIMRLKGLLSSVPADSIEGSMVDIVEFLTNVYSANRLQQKLDSDHAHRLLKEHHVTLDKLLEAALRFENRELTEFVRSVQPSLPENVHVAQIHRAKQGAVRESEILIRDRLIKRNAVQPDLGFDYIIFCPRVDYSLLMYVVKTLKASGLEHFYAPRCEERCVLERIMDKVLSSLGRQNNNVITTREKLVEGKPRVVQQCMRHVIERGIPILLIWTKSMEDRCNTNLREASSKSRIRWLLNELRCDSNRLKPTSNVIIFKQDRNCRLPKFLEDLVKSVRVLDQVTTEVQSLHVRE